MTERLSWRDQKIAEMAYYLWLEAGMPEGRADEFWLEAEKRFEDIASTTGFPN